MELLQLRYFYTVAKTLNISQAAKIHFISQPAMSKMISKLENELGTALFSRVGNHLVLTPSGNLFFANVSSMLTGLDNCVSSISRSATHYSGEIKMLILQHRVTMASIISDFIKTHPKATFQIANEDDGKTDYDMLIAEKDSKNSFDTSVLLKNERINILVSANSRLAMYDSVHLSNIRSENFIFLHNKNAWLSNQLKDMSMDAGLSPNVNVVCNDLYCMKEYLLGGLGIMFFPHISWKHMLDDSVKEIILDPPVYRDVNLFWNAHKKNNELITLFANEIMTSFSKLSSGL